MQQAPKQLKELMETWPAEVVADILATVISMAVAVGELKATAVDGFVEFDWDYLLGGAPCLVDSYNDLKEIKILNFAVEQVKDITETPGVFEVAEQLYGGRYTLLYNTTSNSGGTAYYIPSKFYMSCPNILKSIALSNEETNASN